MDEQSPSSDKPLKEAQDVRPEVSSDNAVDQSGAHHVMPVALQDSYPLASVRNKDTSIHTQYTRTPAYATSHLVSWINSSDDYASDTLVDTFPHRSYSKARDQEKSIHAHLTPDISYSPQARSHTSDEDPPKMKRKLGLADEDAKRMNEEIDCERAAFEIQQQTNESTLRVAYRARLKHGCETCRRRKMKCDETKPICKVCENSNKHCGGYELKQRWLSSNQGKHSPVEHKGRGGSLADERGSLDVHGHLSNALMIGEQCITSISNCLDLLPQGEGSSSISQRPTATPTSVMSAYESEWRDEIARMKLLMHDLRNVSRAPFFGKEFNAQRIMNGVHADMSVLWGVFWQVRELMEGDRSRYESSRNSQASDKDQVAVKGEEGGRRSEVREGEMPPCEMDVLFERASEIIDDLFRETKLLRRCQRTATREVERPIVPDERNPPVGSTEGHGLL